MTPEEINQHRKNMHLPEHDAQAIEYMRDLQAKAVRNQRADMVAVAKYVLRERHKDHPSWVLTCDEIQAFIMVRNGVHLLLADIYELLD